MTARKPTARSATSRHEELAANDTAKNAGKEQVEKRLNAGRPQFFSHGRTGSEIMAMAISSLIFCDCCATLKEYGL